MVGNLPGIREVVKKHYKKIVKELYRFVKQNN